VSLEPLRAISLPLLACLSALAVAAAPGALAAGKRGKHGGGAGEPIYRSLSYGPSRAELLDVYVSGVPSSATVVLVHGGGWRKQRDLRKLEAEALSLQRAGVTVFNINYDQDTNRVPAFPLESGDVVDATRWAAAHAGSFNGSPGEVILIGGSAGGQLVAIAAEQLAVSDPGLVRGVISLSGPMNFVSLWPKIENNTIENENFRLSVELALGMTRTHRFPTAYAEEWSPTLHPPTSSCPSWLIFHSQSEGIPVSQAEEMQAALQHAGCQSTLDVLPGSEHSFSYWTRVREEIGRFIASS
jgi:acetyl esterase/lipase